MGEVGVLQASNNKLEHVRLEKKAALTELDLHGNSLDTDDFSELLRGMWRLQTLDFSQNLVTELPVFRPCHWDEVFLLPNLKFVNLSRNQLEYLHQDSPLLSACLTHFDVSHNRIRGIEAHTFGMVENLQYLYLQDNLIGRFRPDRFFNQQRGLKEVGLYDNPLGLDNYCRITKFFRDAGVHVLEKFFINSHCGYKPLEKHNPNDVAVTFDMGENQGNQELHTSWKWSTWNALILLSLLASLALDVFLILQLRRSLARGIGGKFATPLELKPIF